jgi:hypothetical protein
MSPLQDAELCKTIVVVNASATVGEAASRLQNKASGEDLATWYVVVRLSEERFAVLTAADLNRLFEIQGQGALDQSLQDIEGLLVPSRSVEQDEVELIEARFLQDLSYRQILVVLKDGAPHGLFIVRELGAGPRDSLALFADGALPPEHGALRWIQARAWRADSGAVPARKLALERPNLLAVHIGPSAEERTDAPFPDRELDFSAGAVGITVQVELAGAAVASLERNQGLAPFLAEELPLDDFFDGLFQVLVRPQPVGNGTPLIGLVSQDIRLPATGNSELAEFAVWPQPGCDQVTGRIAIIHRNRIIQTARLTAPVGAESAEGPGLTIEVEESIHPRLDDLHERSEFDAALITADDIGGQLRLTINRNGAEHQVQLNNLQEAITKIRSAVFEAARRPGDTLALDSESMRVVLRSLASQGRLLYSELHARLGDTLDAFERIQLISYGTAFFPIEYVYHGPPLKINAQVCANAVDALERGDCGDCEHQESREWLCPLHFWGFRKVIERYAASGNGSGTRQTAKADRRRLPSPTRTPFGAVHPVLFAASQKAFDFKDGAAWRTRLMEALSRLGGGSPPGEAQTWDDWRDLVGGTQPDPKVLVLLPHSDTAPIDIDVLEIGTQEQLAKDEIDVDLIGEEAIPQLLLLLGCSAAAVTEAFAPYPELFHRAGADIIIAPLAPILGADAAPIAERLVELLVDRLAHGREVAFGELLRDIRRKLLAEGHPGVLGLVGFGDADWRFGG